jgi:Holliday junction DNA helicase RuvB
MIDVFNDLLSQKDKEEENKLNNILRPVSFAEFVGQPNLVEKLKIAIQASQERDEALDSLLLSSSPGLGKDSIVNVIAHESNCNLISVYAPTIRSIPDLIEILVKLKHRDILFINECHRLNIKLEEMLYGAMEDKLVNIKMGNKQIVKLKLNDFTLVGATTLIGDLSQPFKDRFGISYTFDYYSDDELCQILHRSVEKLNITVNNNNTILAIAKRARGTPRIANNLLKRCRDYAQVNNNNVLDQEVIDKAFALEKIDENGLTEIDHRYLSVLYNVYQAGPCGAKAMASSMQVDENTIESIERYLLYSKLIARTQRGRVLTEKGMLTIK